MRIIFALCIAMLTASCVTPELMIASIYTEYYQEPRGKKEFFIISPNQFNLQEKEIGNLIERKLIQKGYTKAINKDEANIAVTFNYSIGQGQTRIYSHSGIGPGINSIESSTKYPRTFQIIIFDLQKSKPPQDYQVIWQGEIYSEGRNRNMQGLAEPFVDALFENYGKTVKNKPLGKVVM